MVVQVPHHRLSPEALRRLIEEFVTRDGTDYGEREAALDSKVQDVLDQLERGEAIVTFDPATGSTHIAPADRGAGAPARAR
jgi:uncharacterized protein YheU (UPF0270 family)